MVWNDSLESVRTSNAIAMSSPGRVIATARDRGSDGQAAEARLERGAERGGRVRVLERSRSATPATNRDVSLLLNDVDVVVAPGRAARLVTLVTRQVVGHAARDIWSARPFCRGDRVALPFRRFSKLTELGKRH